MFHHFGPLRACENSTKISYFMKRFRFKNVLCREFGTLIKVQKTLRFLMFSRLRAFFWHRKIGYFRSPALLRESWKKVSFGGLRGCPGVVKNSKKHLVFDRFWERRVQTAPFGLAKRHSKILHFSMFCFTRFWASGSPSNRPEVPLTRPLSRETRASKRVFLGPSSSA